MRDKQYILDTNTLIEFAIGSTDVTRKALKIGLAKCCMSVVSLHELYFGALLARQKSERYYLQEISRINKLMECFEVLHLPVKAEDYAQVKLALRMKGKPVDEFDMVIAGQAIDAGLTVVTDNVKHFENMPDVKIENWTERQ